MNGRHSVPLQGRDSGDQDDFAGGAALLKVGVGRGGLGEIVAGADPDLEAAVRDGGEELRRSASGVPVRRGGSGVMVGRVR